MRMPPPTPPPYQKNPLLKERHNVLELVFVDNEFRARTKTPVVVFSKPLLVNVIHIIHLNFGAVFGARKRAIFPLDQPVAILMKECLIFWRIPLVVPTNTNMRNVDLHTHIQQKQNKKHIRWSVNVLFLYHIAKKCQRTPRPS